MSFASWNDYFSRQHDNRPPLHHDERKRARTYDDFERDYREMFGIWFDHHYLQLIQQYGSEKADKMIHDNVEKLNELVRQREERAKMRYEFHRIPEGYPVPF